jgi:hypothetical protein
MDSARRKPLGFYNNYEWIPQVKSLSCKTYVVVHEENKTYLQRHKIKVMLFVKIEEKYWYVWICHVENCSGFISITDPFHKFKHRKAKHTLQFAVSIFRFKTTRIKSFYF